MPAARRSRSSSRRCPRGCGSCTRRSCCPLEEHYRFHEFRSPALEDADFKSMVLLVGQYSTGKTTFIRHLIEQDFQGMRLGPEPTTDSFIAVMHGPTEGVVPGSALVVYPRRPFRKLNAFGNAFLNRHSAHRNLLLPLMMKSI